MGKNACEPGPGVFQWIVRFRFLIHAIEATIREHDASTAMLRR
jgi:hypothetical protein